MSNTYHWQPATRTNSINEETVRLIRKGLGCSLGGVTHLAKRNLDYLRGLRDAAKHLKEEQYPLVFNLRELIDAINHHGAINIIESAPVEATE